MTIIRELAVADMTDTGGSLVRRAMDAVTAHIARLNLRVGDTLPGEAHFAQQLGVSRAVMREAFGALAALKLLDVANGRRARVGAIDGSVMATSLRHAVSTDQVTVPEIWDVRRTIESRTAVLAAANRTQEEVDRLHALVDAMAAEAADLTKITYHDIAFHQIIARAGRNALFMQIIRSFAPMMEVAVPIAWKTRVTEEQRVTILSRHRDIVTAIAERNETGAREAMDAHFDASIGAVLREDVNTYRQP